MRTEIRIGFLTLLPLVTLAAVGCGDGGESTPTGPSTPDVSTIVVTSPVDSLIDVDGSAQLSAEATDSHGRDVSVDGFDWQSSNASVAVVSVAGLLQPISVGSTSVTAAAGSVTGSLRIRVVQADLVGITAVLDDPFTNSLVVHLSNTIQTSLQDALDVAALGLASGNLVEVSEGLENAQVAAAAAITSDDVALAAVIQILLDHAQGLLGL